MTNQQQTEFTEETAQDAVAARRVIQWAIVPLVIVTLALGWRYPLLGFSVPIVMLMGIVGGILRGRYVCGILCPRGALFDRIVSAVSPKISIPDSFRSMWLRWPLLIALMGFMAFRIAQAPADIYHWGYVFWQMCVITTAVGVVLALFIHPRSWCSFCPIGTIQNLLGGHRAQLEIDPRSCRECGLCEDACPMDLPVMSHNTDGVVDERDCLKCGECIAACPASAISHENSQ